MLEFFLDQEMTRNAKLRTLYARSCGTGASDETNKLRSSIQNAIQQSENNICDARKALRDPCDCEDEIQEAVDEAVHDERARHGTDFSNIVDEAVLLGVKVPEF